MFSLFVQGNISTPSITADYSHGGQEWEGHLRQAISRLEKGYPMA